MLTLQTMKPISDFNTKIKFVLTDIDDTLTTNGQLTAAAYSALEKLKDHSIKVIPVTGRPAGWCDMIARFWPVDAVIGENGGLYFRYYKNKMIRWSSTSHAEQAENQKKLAHISEQIKKQIPLSAVSADQFCRINDLAVDFCEDIPKLPDSDIHKIVEIFNQNGATAKISSIHVNGWFGTFNKVTTAKKLLKDEFKLSESEILDQCVYIGDSPNDEPLFENFKYTFGVANIRNFQDQIKHLPQYVSKSESGQGFCEIIDQILKN